MQPIKFKVGKQTIKGTIISPKRLSKKNPGILFIHGWTSSQTGYIPRAEAVSRRGAICLTFDIRGHGESDGVFRQLSRQDHFNDVLAAYDFLVSQEKVNKQQIGVVGASYGGYLASILTSKRPVKWLVLRAPALYKDESFDMPTATLIRDDVKVYRSTNIQPTENMALKALTKFKGKMLIVESENDEEIPKQTIENYFRAINPRAIVTHEIIQGADHSLSRPEWKEKFIKILSEWFEKEFLYRTAKSGGLFK